MFRRQNYQIVEDPDLCGDGEVEVNEVDVVGPGFKDLRLFRNRLLETTL